jgi:hypothetical protein
MITWKNRLEKTPKESPGYNFIQHNACKIGIE